MRKLPVLTSLVVILMTSVLAVSAQTTTPPTKTDTQPATNGNFAPGASLDKSPMDMSYFPVDYPILKIQDKTQGPPIARVVYSRPQKKGRHLFGDLVQYGQVWRLGANEATEIEFFRDVKIDGKKVKKGRYTLYALVNPDKWALILNKETDIWGAFRYDSTKDVLRTVVPVQKQGEVTEAFSMDFNKTKDGASLAIHWDDVRVEMPFSW